MPSGLLGKTSMAKIKHIIHLVAYQYRIVTFISYTGVGEHGMSYRQGFRLQWSELPHGYQVKDHTNTRRQFCDAPGTAFES